MKEEVLRLDRVTYLDQGVSELNHFCLNIFSGEIMGLMPVNGLGVAALIALLRQNLPIHYGYVYYRERLVNQWLHSDGSYNRVGIVENRSGLAGNLTVADNVFVLRPGFGKQFIRRSVLRTQLEPFLREIGVEKIGADTYVQDLTAFQRVVVEIVKAVVAGNRLIILLDAGAIVGDAELRKLHGILRQYAAKGISFLYVSQHYEEMRRICSRVALMINGQIAKILPTKGDAAKQIQQFGLDDYAKLERAQRQRPPNSKGPPALEIRALYHGAIAGLHLSVSEGECVVVQDLDNRMIDDLVQAVTAKRQSAAIRVPGQKAGLANPRDVAVIQRLAAGSMLFPDLSYLDNLCFMIDHRLPRVWRSAKPKQSIRREYTPWLGADVFDRSVDELTQAEKYDLIYARIHLQRPKVAICVQPFMQADVERRMHIWRLLERLLEKNIAVVILAVNLSDTLFLADRLVQIRDGRVHADIPRAAFHTIQTLQPDQEVTNQWIFPQRQSNS